MRQLYDDLVENLEQKKITCAIFLDLKRAFDTVNHSILLQKSEKYGIRGLPLQLLRSYLSDRTQYTVVNNHKLKASLVSRGVPQGSTLGPLLFTVYVNDLPKCSGFITKLFDDDAVLTISNTSETKLSFEVNREIAKVELCMKMNKLTINYNKTKFMIFTQKKHFNNCKVHIDNHKIEQVKQIKYLGIVFDDKLTRKTLIQYICTKFSKGSWALLKFRDYVNINSLKTVYYSLIYSHIQYCITTWGVASATALEPLEKMHKRVIRIITNSPFQSRTTPIFKEINLLKINDVFKLKMAEKMQKYKNNPQLRSTQIISNIEETHNYNTRHSFNQNYFLPQKRTELGKKSFSFIEPYILQKIPSELKGLPLSKFKTKLKQHLISKY